MSAGPFYGTFTTYGIVDPRTGCFMYVGQTSHFEYRRASHLRTPQQGRKRPKTSVEVIDSFMFDALAAGIVPVMVVLETVSTWKESLQSESAWVKRLAAENHPLLNRTHEHREAIRLATEGDPRRPRTLPDRAEDIRACQIQHSVRNAAPACDPGDPKKRSGSGAPRPKLQTREKNHGLAWTEARDGELKRHFHAGAGALAIASAIGRTPCSVRARLVRLGLSAERQDLRD